MAEIIDCSRGATADLDYVISGKKPPWYTEEEWYKMTHGEISDERMKQLENNWKVLLAELDI